eukprot:TRINITY_DN6145_c0_g1_i5.p1 TRINITY_DN6145_c0_g1~~TRINITY_DN6145_c0_g1_i5.p1  ORF type:complete len:436 (+),score=65.16 TRINITY_DN6145_c0_g1_i5:72-1379(+)
MIGNDGKERNCDFSKLVIDCGAYSVKLGFAHNQLTNPSKYIPNFVATGKNQAKFIGDEIEHCRDMSGLFFKRPFDKGYLVNWKLQKQILNLTEVFKHFGKNFEASEIDLLLTEPCFNAESIRQNTYEVVFEEYGFKSVFSCLSQFLSLYQSNLNSSTVSLYNASSSSTSNGNKIIPNPCGVVLDCGFSFTHVVPFFDNTKMNYAIKRIDVGGKVLTNYLKEIVSHRHWNMMSETILMNTIKERTCYVPSDFQRDLNIAKLRGDNNKIRQLYVLPDYISNKTGYIKGVDPVPAMPYHYSAKVEEQILVMNTERLIPEILFRPSDVGINQAGVAESIVQAVEETPKDLHELMYSNIVIMGGSTLFPGFKERLHTELRSLIPSEYQNININVANHPITSAWCGGSSFAQHPDYANYTVAKESYEEHGWLICKRRFDSM